MQPLSPSSSPWTSAQIEYTISTKEQWTEFILFYEQRLVLSDTHQALNIQHMFVLFSSHDICVLSPQSQSEYH
jgi:hypothetical protein